MTMPEIASLSLDLDNKWSYLKTRGSAAWQSFPSYFDLLVPRVLEFLAQRELRITFFVVGQDAALDKNRSALEAIAEAGHEIANHSFGHEPWLHLYSESEIEQEISEAERHIEETTGHHPKGFRGPGFSLSEATLRVLTRCGYEYDCTTFPNFLNPVARAYYLMTTKMSPEERAQRNALFGSWRDGLRPVKPYRWQLGDAELTEIPVTTMPIFKVPIHFSYILYLRTFSATLAKAYFGTALAMCKVSGTQPSLLLHPLDFLGADDDSDLAFFPAMNLRSEIKIKLLGQLMDLLSKRYRIVPMREHAYTIAQSVTVPTLSPSFLFGGR